MTAVAQLPTELTIAPAEGAALVRILAAADTGGLAPDAFRRFDTARRMTAWGHRHFRRLALMDSGGLVASAEQSDLTGTLDNRPVSIYGIGGVLSHANRPAGQAPAIVARLTADAERRGADVVLMFGGQAHLHADLEGFERLPTTDVEITVKEDDRRGAPMMLVRDGTDRDLPAIEAMGEIGSRLFRFHLNRDADFIKHGITMSRLRAGLAEPGARQLRFVIAEEGTTAAAYVVLSVAGHQWTIEACGDRDPTGARVGGLLQALIAVERAEQRPVIRGWLPAGFVPPQVTIRPLAPSPPAICIRRLRSSTHDAPLSSDDVLYWRSDAQL